MDSKDHLNYSSCLTRREGARSLDSLALGTCFFADGALASLVLETLNVG